MRRMLSFPVRKCEAVLVGPARATPRERKRLSDIDSIEQLRNYMSIILVYRGGQPEQGDPVSVIRGALSEALVYYYPLAGRIREVAGDRGLVVDCTGEGVMFAEAEADVRLVELEGAGGLGIPFPISMDQLQLNMEVVNTVLDYPLVHIQVTRLVCGGFIVGVRLCHSVCDAQGFALFLTAIADMARGLASPAVSPAWSRELLVAPPKREQEQEQEHEKKHVADIAPADVAPAADIAPDDMVIRSFVFSPACVAALKRNLSILPGATSFEVLTACLWRARTTALGLPQAALTIAASFRSNAALRLPHGYYGNAFAPFTVVASADELTRGTLDDVVGLVQRAKATSRQVRSITDLLTLPMPPPHDMPKMFRVSDLRRLGFHCVDLGWGEPLYGGPAVEGTFVDTCLIATKNGEVSVPILLPMPAMERFVTEINKLLTSELIS